MHVGRSSRRHLAQIHRYFPEWADRPQKKGVRREADRNSYMAGGYAEEFGYRAQPGLPAPAPPLASDPEGCRQWRAQIGTLHPGYPECAKPLDRDFVDSRGDSGGDARQRTRSRAAAMPPGEHSKRRNRPPHDGVIRVGSDHAEVMSFTARLFYVWKSLQVLRRHFGSF